MRWANGGGVTSQFYDVPQWLDTIVDPCSYFSRDALQFFKHVWTVDPMVTANNVQKICQHHVCVIQGDLQFVIAGATVDKRASRIDSLDHVNQ